MDKSARHRIEAALTIAFADWFRQETDPATRWLPAALARVAMDVAIPLLELEFLEFLEEHQEGDQ